MTPPMLVGVHSNDSCMLRLPVVYVFHEVVIISHDEEKENFSTHNFSLPPSYCKENYDV